MNKLLSGLLVGLALSLGACGAPGAGPNYPVIGTVDQTKMEQSAYAARSTYAGLLNLAAEYVSLPRCVTGGPALCSSQAVVFKIREYSNAANVATKGAVDIARSPTKTQLALANAVADANRAVEVFRSALAEINPQAKAVT